MEEYKYTFKLCSLLFQYPEQSWIRDKEIEDSIALIKNQEIRFYIDKFWDYVKQTPSRELAENYVKWFDFNDRTTLYLTYKKFGDNRERGLALVKLKMEFAKANFYIKNDELPDYLPLILEFASEASDPFVQKIFLIHKKAIDDLLFELMKDHNPYGNLLKACEISMAAWLHGFTLKAKRA